MKFRNSLISVSLATLLVGCGSSSGGSKGGDDTNDTPPSASIGNTILNSELIYNRVIENKTEADVATYINSKFGGAVTTQNITDIETAINNAKTAHSSADAGLVTAAVLNKAIAMASTDADGIKDITVTAAEIAAANVPALANLNVAKSFDVNVSADIAIQQAAGWADAKDIDIRHLTSKNGKLIGGAKEHNGLVVVDVAAKTIKFNAVSTITDAGHGDLSPSVDAASGASEPGLQGVKLTSDGSTIYYNVPSRGDKSNADIVGLFKTALGADGSITTTEGTAAADLPDGNGTKIITTDGRLNMIVSKYEISPDGSKVVVFDAEKQLHLYNGDLDTSLGATDAADIDAVTGVAVSNTNVFTAAAGSNAITKRGITGTLDATGTTIDIGFTADEMVINSDGSKMVAFTHGHDHGGVTSMALVNLSNDTLIDSGSVVFTSDGAAVSPDMTSMALYGHEEKSTKIVNLTVKGFNAQGSSKGSARNAAYISETKIALTDGRKKITVLDISVTTDNNTLAEEMALAKDTINEDTINGGPFVSVIKDLNLNPNYGSIDIAWTSSLPTNILNIATGGLTRPANGASDVSGGTLAAALTGSFRDETLNENVPFAGLNVRKLPKIIPAGQMSTIPSGRADYMAANQDGTVMVGPVQDAEDIYSMGSFKVDGAGAITIASTPFRLDTDDTVKGAGIVGDYAVFTTSNKDENLSRIYTVAINDDGTLENGITNQIVNAIPTGKPEKMEWTADNSKAAVILKTSDKKFHAAIYSIGGDGSINLDSNFSLGNIGYRNYGPMAINDNATKVFQRDGKKVFAIDAVNGVEANATVDDIARVWYAHDFVFVHTYGGIIHTYNEALVLQHTFYTGTGGRMYGGEGREIDGKNYYIVPVQQGSEAVNGIYVFEVLATGELKEVAFVNKPEGADRMAVSGNGERVFFSFRDATGARHVATVSIDPANDL